jgi:hypothetical protein
MKKRSSFVIAGIILVLVAVALFFVFFPTSSKTVQTENFSFTDKVYLSAEDTTLGSLSIDLNIDLPVAYHNENILDNIKTILRTELFGDVFLSFPQDSLLNYYAIELSREYIDNNADFARKISDESHLAFNNSVVLEGFALLNDENIFSYGISRFVDFGGAHPIKTRLFYNFNLKDGKVIFEDDIFEAGYQTELTEIIKNKLLQDNNQHEETPNLESLDNSVYFTDEIKPNGNFYINDESICFVFNPYEIAPYYIGETEVVLPYSLIHHLMKPKNPLEYLVTAALNNN